MSNEKGTSYVFLTGEKKAFTKEKLSKILVKFSVLIFKYIGHKNCSLLLHT